MACYVPVKRHTWCGRETGCLPCPAGKGAELSMVELTGKMEVVFPLIHTKYEHLEKCRASRKN